MNDSKKTMRLNPSNELAHQFELESAVEAMKRNLSSIIDYMQIDAKMRRAKFKALVSEGFTEAQALELCKGKTIET